MSKAALTSDTLDRFKQTATTNPEKAAIMLLWLMRHHYPDLSIPVSEHDINALAECAAYLKITPALKVDRRPAIPARPAQPPTALHPQGVPGFEAKPAGKNVMIQLVDAESGDTFKPVENNEEDFERQAEAQRKARIRTETPQLAQMVHAAAARGEYSQELVMELAQAAITLATGR